MGEKRFWVYMMTNKNDTVIYTGITNDLERRVKEHKAGEGCSFTKRYNIYKLVFYQEFASPRQAIKREKQIKAGSRDNKEELIEKINPEWNNLSAKW